jgi:hypothetical protein
MCSKRTLYRSIKCGHSSEFLKAIGAWLGWACFGTVLFDMKQKQAGKNAAGKNAVQYERDRLLECSLYNLGSIQYSVFTLFASPAS